MLLAAFRVFVAFLIVAFLALPRLAAEPLPLKRAVELALAHSTTAASANADEQRVFASYREARNQYIPQFILGSGLGKSWGYPLSLEGSAPSIVNLNSQSAIFNPSLRDFVRAAKTDWSAATLQSKDQRNQVIQDTVLSYAELSKWEALVGHLQEEHAAALQTEQLVSERIKEGVDSPHHAEQGAPQHGAPALAPGRSARRHRRHPQPAFAPDRACRRPPLKPSQNRCLHSRK